MIPFCPSVPSVIPLTNLLFKSRCFYFSLQRSSKMCHYTLWSKWDAVSCQVKTKWGSEGKKRLTDSCVGGHTRSVMPVIYLAQIEYCHTQGHRKSIFHLMVKKENCSALQLSLNFRLECQNLEIFPVILCV